MTYIDKIKFKDDRLYDLHDVRIEDIDKEVTEGSENPITSGAVYELLTQIESQSGSIENIDATLEELREILESKVDKVEGKTLSTEDFSTEEKEKLVSIEDNAQENVIESISVNGHRVDPYNKNVSISVPTALTDLTDDSSHRTVSEAEKGYWSSKQDRIGDLDSIRYAASTAIHEHQDISGKQDVIVDLQEIRENAAEGASKVGNVQADWNASSGLAEILNKPEIPSIEGLATEEYVDNKVADLINSAPETLDTLQELADALGDDPNFATTISLELGKKYEKPSAGVPKSDLNNSVQESLNKADSALQSHQSLKTINHESLVGSGNIDIQAIIKANEPIPASWNTNGTLRELVTDISADETAIQGKVYLSTVHLSDLPSGMIQAELKVEILQASGSSKIILFTVTSENQSPYYWQCTSAYGRIGNWITFVPSDEAITDADLVNFIDNGRYNSTNKKIELKHGNTVISRIDASDFIKDGMVNTVVINNGNLVISFNTDSGKEDISIPLTDIFNPSNYYDKTAADGRFVHPNDLATVATSGSYADLSNTPTVPTFSLEDDILIINS